MSHPINDQLFDLIAEILPELTREQAEKLNELVKDDINEAYAYAMKCGEELARKEMYENLRTV